MYVLINVSMRQLLFCLSSAVSLSLTPIGKGEDGSTRKMKIVIENVRGSTLNSNAGVGGVGEVLLPPP